MSEVFEQSFPYYLAIGMSSDQYWFDDPWLVHAYREAHKLSIEMRNEELYMQGAYNFKAFSIALSNFSACFSKTKSTPQPYLDKPIRITPLSEAEKAEQAEVEKQKVIAQLNRWQQSFNKNQS